MESLTSALLLVALAGVGVNSASTPHAAVNYRFMVQVESTNRTYNYTSLCGGALLSSTHVITTASCVLDDVTAMKVYSGSEALWTTGNDGVAHAVRELRKHPSFRGEMSLSGLRYLHDVALVRLETPVVLGPMASAVSVTKSKQQLPAGHAMSLAGWGVYYFGGAPEPDSPKRLEVDTVSVITPHQCKLKFPTGITSQHMCVKGAPDVGLSGSVGFVGRVLYGLMSWGSSVLTDLAEPTINSFILSTMKTL